MDSEFVSPSAYEGTPAKELLAMLQPATAPSPTSSARETPGVALREPKPELRLAADRPGAPETLTSFDSEASGGPEVLGILLTSKCNFACRHCCNESHPRNSHIAPFEEIARLIDEASSIPSVREIGLSGGEPFLFKSLLRRVVQHAAARGLSASVTTNGFWARSHTARQLLNELRSDGLAAVHVSTSAFHQEFLPLEIVVQAVEASLDADLRVTVNIVATPGFAPSVVKEALGHLPGRVGFVVMPSIPAGRAERDLAPAEFEASFEVPPGNCRTHFRKLAVDLVGDVYPCCSPGGFTPPLRMGNIHEAPLSAIVAGSARDSLLAILESVGPGYFLPFLRASGDDADLPAAFSDQCHLCHAMLSSPRRAAIVAAAAVQLVNELAVASAVDPPVISGRMAAVMAATGRHSHDGVLAPEPR